MTEETEPLVKANPDSSFLLYRMVDRLFAWFLRCTRSPEHETQPLTPISDRSDSGGVWYDSD